MGAGFLVPAPGAPIPAPAAAVGGRGTAWAGEDGLGRRPHSALQEIPMADIHRESDIQMERSLDDEDLALHGRVRHHLVARMGDGQRRDEHALLKGTERGTNVELIPQNDTTPSPLWDLMEAAKAYCKATAYAGEIHGLVEMDLLPDTAGQYAEHNLRQVLGLLEQIEDEVEQTGKLTDYVQECSNRLIRLGQRIDDDLEDKRSMCMSPEIARLLDLRGEPRGRGEWRRPLIPAQLNQERVMTLGERQEEADRFGRILGKLITEQGTESGHQEKEPTLEERDAWSTEDEDSAQRWQWDSSGLENELREQEVKSKLNSNSNSQPEPDLEEQADALLAAADYPPEAQELDDGTVMLSIERDWQGEIPVGIEIVRELDRFGGEIQRLMTAPLHEIEMDCS